MSRDVSIYVKDMLENIQRAEKFTAGMAYEEFEKDDKANFAVMRCIQVIGEAAKNVPEEVRRKYPKVPWKDVAGMRDKITHFYFGVSLKTVWLVDKEDMPVLKPLLKEIIDDISK